MPARSSFARSAGRQSHDISKNRLLGANGAGKTTLLRAISGLLDVHEGEITKGQITLEDQPIHQWGPSKVVGAGIKQVLEGRRIFAEFTVEENLRIGAHTDRSAMHSGIERIYGLFPVLRIGRPGWLPAGCICCPGCPR